MSIFYENCKDINEDARQQNKFKRRNQFGEKIQKKDHFVTRYQSTKFLQDTSICHCEIPWQYFMLSQDLQKICLSIVQLVGNINYCCQYVKFLHAMSFFNHFGPSGLLALHGSKCPLLMAFFSLSFFCLGYFSPRRGYCRVLKFCMGS